MAEEYILIPGTNRKVFEGTIVILNRLPNLKWVVHNGPYQYAGKRQKGWYFSSIPSDTTMPVFNEDLVNMIIEDDPYPCPPGPGPGPFPPGPFPPGPGPTPPGPPVPVPVPFTPKDKQQLDSAMLTVNTLAERDKLGSQFTHNGKIVRVNDTDGHGKIEYYSWNAATSSWEEASLGYRYMTRDEINEAIGSDIVDIAWSNEDGALVITNHNADTDNVELSGLAHDIAYTAEDLTIRIPIYGKDDLVITIPRDRRITAIRFEKEWEFPDSSIKPAIVATVTDGVTEEDIAGDATDLYNIYEGAETATAVVLISSETSKVTAEVKLSSIVNNAIQVDNEGLFVDLSGYVGKVAIDRDLLLAADGQGGFIYAGSGVEIETTTAIADLTNPEKKVVTANLIADAIAAAIASVVIDIDERLNKLESQLDFGTGADGILLVTSGDGLARSGKKVGSSELPEIADTDTLATEEAVVKALSWQLD